MFESHARLWLDFFVVAMCQNVVVVYGCFAPCSSSGGRSVGGARRGCHRARLAAERKRLVGWSASLPPPPP